MNACKDRESIPFKNIKSIGKSFPLIFIFFLVIIISKVGFQKRTNGYLRDTEAFLSKLPSDSLVIDNERIFKFYRKIDLTNNYFSELENINLSKFLIDNEKCRIPDFDVHFRTGNIQTDIEDREIMHCKQSHVNLTYLNDDMILFNKELLLGMGYDSSNISCCYRVILRRNLRMGTFSDRKIRYSRCIPMDMEGGTRLRYSFIRVKCAANGSLSGLTEVIYESFHALPILSVGEIKKKVQFWATCNNSSNKQNGEGGDNITTDSLKTKYHKNDVPPPPNVLLIGIDSTSRMNFMRLMHQTFQLLNDTLKAIEMKGYNKVGSNTFPNLVPLLTSFYVAELRKICFQNQLMPLDNCPFIWKSFSSRNYLTALLEDAPTYAIFNFGKPGFFNPPGDFYLRPFMIALYNNLINKKRHRCLYKSPEKIVLDYIVDLSVASKKKGMPYFIVAWLTELAHQNTDRVGVMDYLLADTLLTLHKKRLLENTILLIMSDHGYRYKSIRRTIRGWYEDKLPMFWISIPPSLQKSHQHWMEALSHNSRQLVTPFDVYETLRDILLLSMSKPQVMKLNQNRKSLGISLFKKHPPRSCEEASIPSQFCACAVPITYSENQTLIMMGAEAIVTYINNMVPPACQTLKIQQVTTSGTFSQNQLNTGNSSSIRQLIKGLITTPGDFLLEARVTVDTPTSGLLNVSVSHVSRVSEMSKRDKSHVLSCLNDTTIDMMEFCYCQ